MARQPPLNEEALVKLGSEKLARLVIGEAKRNAAFRKLVAAALAATKGPAAVAAIIMRPPLLSRILSGGSSKLIRLRSRIGFSL